MIQSYILITRISDVAVSAALLKLKRNEITFILAHNITIIKKIKFSPFQPIAPSSLQDLLSRVQVFGPGLGHTSLYPTSWRLRT